MVCTAPRGLSFVVLILRPYHWYQNLNTMSSKVPSVDGVKVEEVVAAPLGVSDEF